jgi:hypothetical protein
MRVRLQPHLARLHGKETPVEQSFEHQSCHGVTESVTVSAESACRHRSQRGACSAMQLSLLHPGGPAVRQPQLTRRCEAAQPEALLDTLANGVTEQSDEVQVVCRASCVAAARLTVRVRQIRTPALWLFLYGARSQLRGSGSTGSVRQGMQLAHCDTSRRFDLPPGPHSVQSRM